MRQSRHRSTSSTPRWVKVFGIIAIVLVFLFAVVVLTGIGGNHGPWRHLPSHVRWDGSLEPEGGH